jgi:hypothetical protein
MCTSKSYQCFMQKTTQATGGLHSSTCIFFDKDPRDEGSPTGYGKTHFYANRRTLQLSVRDTYIFYITNYSLLKSLSGITRNSPVLSLLCACSNYNYKSFLKANIQDATFKASSQKYSLAIFYHCL